jgi:hypothetical protein
LVNKFLRAEIILWVKYHSGLQTATLMVNQTGQALNFSPFTVCFFWFLIQVVKQQLVYEILDKLVEKKRLENCGLVTDFYQVR